MRTGRDWLTREPQFAAVIGRKGGKTRPKGRTRTDEWLKGYQAGWRASERNFTGWETRGRREP